MRATVAAIVVIATLAIAPTAHAAPTRSCDGGAGAGKGGFYGVASCSTPKPKPKQPGPLTTHPILHTTTPSLEAATAACAAVAGGTNQPACVPDPAAPALPAVTGGDALRALQEVPLPQLASQTQPATKTLVNFDTIFFVAAAQFQQTVTLLGQQVTLDIMPSRFVWMYGDGSQQTTTVPGAKYPAKDIVHRYPNAHLDVAHSVAITWTARFRVGAGPWQDVPGTVTSQGPPTTLHVSEATPVLTGRR